MTATKSALATQCLSLSFHPRSLHPRISSSLPPGRNTFHDARRVRSRRKSRSPRLTHGRVLDARIRDASARAKARGSRIPSRKYDADLAKRDVNRDLPNLRLAYLDVDPAHLDPLLEADWEMIGTTSRRLTALVRGAQRPRPGREKPVLVKPRYAMSYLRGADDEREIRRAVGGTGRGECRRRCLCPTRGFSILWSAVRVSSG